MAKHGKVLPARRPREEDDSILIRSAETIGRVIGTLQRQLDGARGRLNHFVLDTEPGRNGGNAPRSKQQATRKTGTAKGRKATGAVKRASRRVTSTVKRAARPPKSTAARKRAKR